LSLPSRCRAWLSPKSSATIFLQISDTSDLLSSPNFSPLNYERLEQGLDCRRRRMYGRAARAGAGLPPSAAVRLLGQHVRGVSPVHAGQLPTTCSAPALFRAVIDGLLQPVHVDLLEEQARQARWCHEPCLHFFSVGSWWCCGRAVSPSLLLVQGNNEFNPKSTRSMQ
jgi:hypothetical protein